MSESSAATRLVHRLLALGRTVAVAESLTGGAVTASLVDVPGASGCLRGGVVAYATDLKVALLGVDPDLLTRFGAVSTEVALAMAEGVRDRLGATYGLATTGVAGPGPADGRPAGEFHVAVVGPHRGDVRSVRPEDLRGPVSRPVVRSAAVDAVLHLALVRLAAEGGGTGEAPAALESM